MLWIVAPLFLTRLFILIFYVNIWNHEDRSLNFFSNLIHVFMFLGDNHLVTAHNSFTGLRTPWQQDFAVFIFSWISFDLEVSDRCLFVPWGEVIFLRTGKLNASSNHSAAWSSCQLVGNCQLIFHLLRFFVLHQLSSLLSHEVHQFLAKVLKWLWNPFPP